ncbi:MAG: serine/threonine-protein kinase [Candidatus Margulisbacteria bacterium]|nr:serine/threonine-protein kinase [Candidatus Margulisiibacteriota bacterium]
MKRANEIYRNWAPGKFYRALQANGAGGGQDLKAKTAAELTALLTDVDRRRANATPANLAKFDAAKAQIVQAQKFVAARDFYQAKQNVDFTDLSDTDYVNNHNTFDAFIAEHINNVEAGELKTNLQRLQSGAKQQIEARQFYDEFKEHTQDDFAALTNPAALRTRADLQIGKVKGHLRTEIERLKTKAETARAAKAFIDQYEGYSYDDFAKLSDPAAFRTKAESQIGKVEGSLKTEIERLKAKAETAEAAKDFHKKYRGTDFGKLDLAGYSEFITNIDEQIDKVSGSNLGTDLTALKVKAEKDRAEAAKKTVEAKRPANGRRRAERDSDSRIELQDEDIDASEPDIYVGASGKKYRRQAAPLGEGGIGKVYAAEEIGSGRKVAIKELHSAGNKMLVDRLIQEFDATSRVGSKRIVKGLDHGTRPDGAPFIVMELIRGKDLSTMLEEREAANGHFSVEEAVPWLRQVIEGLKAAAARGITHRDIKPQNIFIEIGDFLDREPEFRAVILDFGLAKIIDDQSRVEEGKGKKDGTKTGVVMGTPEYMAPELILLSGLTNEERGLMPPVELRNKYVKVDIYALGVLFYKLLTNKLPFPISRANYGAFASGLAKFEFPEMGSHVSPQLQAVIKRMLAFKPEERYENYDKLDCDIVYSLMFENVEVKIVGKAGTVFGSAAEIASQGPVTVRHQPTVAETPKPRFDLKDPTTADDAKIGLNAVVMELLKSAPTAEEYDRINDWAEKILDNEAFSADPDVSDAAVALTKKLRRLGGK